MDRDDMDRSDQKTRREFTVETVMALLGGVTITISGCGGSSPAGPSTPPSGSGSGTSATISANHGHRAVIDSAEIAAGQAITLQIRGTADHPHTVDLSGTDVTLIGAGTRVSKTSSSQEGHTHIVTFN